MLVDNFQPKLKKVRFNFKTSSSTTDWGYSLLHFSTFGRLIRCANHVCSKFGHATLFIAYVTYTFRNVILAMPKNPSQQELLQVLCQYL